MSSESTEVINSSSQSSNKRKTKNRFDYLVEKLLVYFSSTNSFKERHDQKYICEIFDQLQHSIGRDFPTNRRMDGLNVCNNAKIIYLHMLYLKNMQRPIEMLTQKVTDVLCALQQITKLSHDQYYGPIRALENRRLQISLGLVEVLSELFVLDIDIFGIQLNPYEKCSKFRRSIGNALMNLVYQQREAKFRLCTNQQFLIRVADVIEHFYAGLIQNVSYNVDQTIWHHLAIIVPPLVRSAVNITSTECDGRKVFDFVTLPSQRKQQLIKILSALWNLAEDPVENKRVMCHDVPEFVTVLLRILRCDQNELQLIQAATGILKHLCDYLLQFPELFLKIIRKGVTSAFMRQLTSSSSDLVTDSLTALYTLSRHPIVGRELLSSQSYIQQISYLTRNTNEGISRASRLVLNNVYSATAYFAFQPDRHIAKLPINPNSILSPLLNHNDHFIPRTCLLDEKPNDVLKFEEHIERQKDHFDDNKLENNDILSPSIDLCGQDLPTSVMCTRNASSRSSFNSADLKVIMDLYIYITGFQIANLSSTSVRSSVNQSPASATDLPDSPSQCSLNKVFQLKEMELQILKALDENGHSGHCTNADISGNSDVHNGKTSLNDSCLFLKDRSCEGILAEAIRDYMPKPKEPNATLLNVSVTRSSTPILTPISSNSPCKLPSESDEPKHKSYLIINSYNFKHQECNKLLEECIQKAMPSPKNIIASYQFEERDTSCSATSSSNTKIQHNNSEEDIRFGVESLKDSIGADNNVVNTQLIVLDCFNITSSCESKQTIQHDKSLIPNTCSNIPLSTEFCKKMGNRTYKNQPAILSVSNEGLQVNGLQSSTYRQAK